MNRFVHVAAGLVIAGAGAGASTGCALDSEITVLDERQPTYTAGDVTGCFTTNGGQILPIDLETEALGASIGRIQSHDVASLGVIGGALVSCTLEAGIEIIDLATNASELIGRTCDGVTSDGARVWVNSVRDQALYEYQGLQALRDDTPSRKLPSAYATRLGLGEGRLLAAWHSANQVLAVDLETGATTPIAIPGYDGWIFGLAEREKARYILGGWVERGIRVYDRVDGTLVQTLFADKFLQGLACAK